MRARYNRSGGFTLVEIIVTLVVLALLAGVAIPSMGKWIDRSQEKTCLADRYEILDKYSAAEALLYSDGQTATLAGFLTGAGAYAAYAQDLTAMRCPSGGVYSANGETGIICSVHGDMQGNTVQGLVYVSSDRQPNVVLDEAWAAAWQEAQDNNWKYSQWGGTGDINSSSPSGWRTAGILKYLNANGINLAEQNIQSWKIQKEYAVPVFYWSDQDVSKLPIGTNVRVVRYNSSKGTFTAGYVPVIARSEDNGATYFNCLGSLSNGWSEIAGQDAVSKQSCETTTEIFNAAPVTNP